MREIGDPEAEGQFGEVFGWVESHASREDARAAVARIRARAERSKFSTFDWSEWKAYRDESRP